MPEKSKIKANFIDRAINFVAPRAGIERMRARAVMAMTDEFTGASRDRRSMFNFFPRSESPDDVADKYTRETLVERSRWLVRNNAIASGTIDSNCIYSIGPGLNFKSKPKKEILGLTEEQAKKIGNEIENEISIFAESTECDIERTLNFYEKQNQTLGQIFEAGGCLTYLPYLKRGKNPYGLKIQTIEYERLNNKDNAADSATLVQGVQKDENGAPTNYHICSVYPDSKTIGTRNWNIIPAYKDNDLKNILHHFVPRRPGQTRGIPYLAPIIEYLYTITGLRKAELDAIVVQSFFAMIIETEGARGVNTKKLNAETGAKPKDDDIKLGPAVILDLKPGEKAVFGKPERPNSTFDSFLNSCYQEIGIGLNQPAQIMMKNYNTSYTSAQAAFLDVWKFYIMKRVFTIRSFCEPIKENIIFEAVVSGRLKLPGFLNDIRLRRAWLNGQWVGPSRGQIDPVKELTAAQMADDYGYKTSEQITEEIYGGDFNDNIAQKKYEIQLKTDAGMPIGKTPAPAPAPPQDPNQSQDGNPAPGAPA